MRKTLNKFMIILMVLLGTLILGMGTVKGAVSLTGNTSVKKGDTVRVNYGEKVRAAQFALNYDATKLTYVGVVGGDYNSATKRFAITTQSQIDTLSSATFTFTAKEEGVATISIGGVKFKSADKGSFTPDISVASISTTINPKTTPKPPTTDPEKPSGGNSGNSGSNTSKPGGNNSSTTQKPTFTNKTATVYATETVSIRDSWSTSGKLLGTLQKNKSITRTGIGSNGWSRVNYNGKTAYINSSYLTTTKPKDDKKDDDKDKEKDDDKNNTTNNETTNNEVNNTTNNTQDNEVNSTSNELVNNEYQGSNEVDNEKKDNKKYIEFIIIGVIIAAILVIIVSEISAKKRSKKKSKR